VSLSGPEAAEFQPARQIIIGVCRKSAEKFPTKLSADRQKKIRFSRNFQFSQTFEKVEIAHIIT
jgi:hypothetical protein